MDALRAFSRSPWRTLSLSPSGAGAGEFLPEIELPLYLYSTDLIGQAAPGDKPMEKWLNCLKQ
jgi:hypothetical protein